MPCRYDPSPDEVAEMRENDEAKRRKPLEDKINTLTKLLCEACTLLRSEKIGAGDRLLLAASPELKGWAANHEKSDRKRKADAVAKLRAVAAELGYDVESAAKLARILV